MTSIELSVDSIKGDSTWVGPDRRKRERSMFGVFSRRLWPHSLFQVSLGQLLLWVVLGIVLAHSTLDLIVS